MVATDRDQYPYIGSRLTWFHGNRPSQKLGSIVITAGDRMKHIVIAIFIKGWSVIIDCPKAYSGLHILPIEGVAGHGRIGMFLGDC